MRDEMAGDVAAERQLNVIERLLALMPRSRGFWVSTDGNVSVYLASPRARLPAEKREGYPKPPKREPRSEQAGSKRAENARTRRSAARAAKHAERREQAELRLQQLACKMAKVQRWRRAQDAWTAWMRDRTASSPARCPCSGPRRASAAGAQQPRRAHALSLWLSGEAPPHTGRPSLPAACHPPKRAQDEKAQARGRRRGPRRRRHTAGPHHHLRSRPRPTRSPTAQPYPTAPSTHLAAVRLLARLIPTRTGLGPETNIPAWGRECRPPQG